VGDRQADQAAAQDQHRFAVFGPVGGAGHRWCPRLQG
jgi:hypothetical protein